MLQRGAALAIWGLAASSLPAAADGESLIDTQVGTLPILLTAPHGGTAVIPNAPPRTTGVTVRDEFTDEVARGVAKRLEELLSAKPYFVIAKFQRRFADANRSETEGLESAAARPPYTAYHQAIRGYVDAIRKAHPDRGLLLDIHGQVGNPGVLHRGTRNGVTVTRLLKRAGDAGLVGEKSIWGSLKSQGFTIFPDSAHVGEPPEAKAYGGGFTVGTYGSQQPDGIDAIQIEIGRDLRAEKAAREKLIEALAQAVATYYREYQKG
jgi:N-formylglutamate amidohydrolase